MHVVCILRKMHCFAIKCNIFQHQCSFPRFQICKCARLFFLMLTSIYLYINIYICAVLSHPNRPNYNDEFSEKCMHISRQFDNVCATGWRRREDGEGVVRRCQSSPARCRLHRRDRFLVVTKKSIRSRTFTKNENRISHSAGNN